MPVHLRLALCLLLALVAAAEVAAHLAVAKTSPAAGVTVTEPPRAVQVWFTQAPAPRVSRLDLSGPSGTVELGELQVDAKERSLRAAVPGRLPAGQYELTWRTAGADGHVQRGTFTFTVKPAE